MLGRIILGGKTMQDELSGFETMITKLVPVWNLFFLLFYAPALGLTVILVKDPETYTPAIIACIIQSTIVGIVIWTIWKKKKPANQSVHGTR